MSAADGGRTVSLAQDTRTERRSRRGRGLSMDGDEDEEDAALRHTHGTRTGSGGDVGGAMSGQRATVAQGRGDGGH